MSTRTTTTARARLIAAAVLVLTASVALTGCDDGEGVRDEGPSSASSQSLGRPACAPVRRTAHGPAQRPADTPAQRPQRPQRSFCAASTAQ
ncbi:hypothetical protein ACWEGQ_26945 [Streptomyces seoulensis]